MANVANSVKQSDSADPNNPVNFHLKEEEEDSDEEELNDDDQFQDEFHDAVEDVCQFSVTLPRQNNNIIHHRNPSNISKLYLKESDSSEDEQEQLIKVNLIFLSDTA